MRRLRRARRPLVALIVLVLALLIGYLVREARSHGGAHHAAVIGVAQTVRTGSVLEESGCRPLCR